MFQSTHEIKIVVDRDVDEDSARMMIADAIIEEFPDAKVKGPATYTPLEDIGMISVSQQFTSSAFDNAVEKMWLLIQNESGWYRQQVIENLGDDTDTAFLVDKTIEMFIEYLRRRFLNG